MLEKRHIYTGTYGQKFHLLPFEKMQEMQASVPRTLTRPKGENIMNDWLDAICTGRKETAASFDYGARLTEFTLLGNLAQHAPVGQKNRLGWTQDACKKRTELNEWLKRPYRKGWPS